VQKGPGLLENLSSVGLFAGGVSHLLPPEQDIEKRGGLVDLSRERKGLRAGRQCPIEEKGGDEAL